MQGAVIAELMEMSQSFVNIPTDSFHAAQSWRNHESLGRSRNLRHVTKQRLASLVKGQPVVRVLIQMNADNILPIDFINIRDTR